MIRGLKRALKGQYTQVRVKWTRRLAERKLARRGGFWNGTRFVPHRRGAEGGEIIARLITRGGACMIGRYGIYELNAVAAALRGRKGGKDVMHPLCFNAGFFPCEESLLDGFKAEYCEAASKLDCLAISCYRRGAYAAEEALFQDFSPSAVLIEIDCLNFFKFENSWTRALAGKRILVVHPYADLILKQYAKRALLFPDDGMLPELGSIEAIEAVQSIGGSSTGFGNWFEALRAMKDKMSSHEFDVAIIGAGAYGFPLAAHAKSLGAVGLHLGGVTQILFGIMGRRWEARYMKLFNDAWVWPDARSRPANYERIEGGCYW